MLVHGYLLPTVRVGGQVAVNFALEPSGHWSKVTGHILELEHPWQMGRVAEHSGWH